LISPKLRMSIRQQLGGFPKALQLGICRRRLDFRRFRFHGITTI
jgi:hypothetical protein